MSGIGLKARWECPACGNVIKTTNPAWNKKVLKATFDEPSRCGCGRKGNFNLLSLQSCQYILEKEDDEEKPVTKQQKTEIKEQQKEEQPVEA